MEKISRTKTVFFSRFYILCENFSKIEPIIKKITNFVNDPLKTHPKGQLTRATAVAVNDD